MTNIQLTDGKLRPSGLSCYVISSAEIFSFLP